MLERRTEPRIACSDKVNVEWADRSGRIRRALANLEDVSKSGARLVLACPIPPKSPILIANGKREVKGTVRYCTARAFGYVLGVRFDPGLSWPSGADRPERVNPRRLDAHTIDLLSSLRPPRHVNSH